MTIKLSVVGIFFGIDLPFETDTRVIDVLAEAKSLVELGGVTVGPLNTPVSKFDYDVTAAPNQSLQSFSVKYDGPVKGRNAGGTYPAGEYHLAEDAQEDKHIHNIWQYYTLNAAGISTNPDGKVRFLDSPNSIVVAGGHLIWRRVAIMTGPTS